MENDLSNIILPEIPISLENTTIIKLAVLVFVIVFVSILMSIYLRKQLS